MANIRTLASRGQVWIHNDKAYRLKENQPSAGVPTAAVSVGDTVDVAGVTFNRDDSEVVAGGDHRIWTACDMAIANLSAHKGSMSIGSVLPEHGMNTMYTPTVGGILRFWGGIGAVPWGPFQLYVSGAPVLALSRGCATMQDAYAIKLLAGQVVALQISSGSGNVYTCSYIFLPYVWSPS